MHSEQKKTVAWNAKCPLFLGNFAPRTSNFCLKNRALGFPGACICLFSPGPVCRQTYDRRPWNYEERPAHSKPPRGKDPRVKSWALKNDTILQKMTRENFRMHNQSIYTYLCIYIYVSIYILIYIHITYIYIYICIYIYLFCFVKSQFLLVASGGPKVGPLYRALQ